ncbi:HlyD family efflux transporter periplasmic adaptor subunit [Pseudoalteromonas sp. J010]|uniref:efflux RND transporter periplasmic adaptor subunit n=1 Tax=Pseudoalteromonas sp. J010 TaxID=998465 RepID=UPI000F649CC4|nr:HlyD family efflux transporter periplasmic adaptor subunit [Pseudoalteromonas sp. J010]RRS08463.1 HlyD family efflux transporter periplasmic adaptor subunit [Pseudoalteromonas sp. J010]
MDIKLAKTQRLPMTKVVLLVIALLVGGLVVFTKAYTQSASNVVFQDELIVAKVQQGEFELSVKGLGSLVLEKRHLVTSISGGKVVEVLVKPGEMVTQGMIIARLENPALHQTLTQKQSLLSKTVAQHEAELAELQAKVQQAKTAHYDALLAYKAEKAQWQAQKTLIDKGNSTISMLDHQRSEFAMQRSQKQVELQQTSVATQQAVLQAKMTAQQAEQASLYSEIKLLKENITALKVRAPITGQIQDVFIELGMQLASTSSVAEVADPRLLVAKINVAELDAPQVQVGQQATIDTYTSRFGAVVNRVSPQVVNGQVEVELSITNTLPKEARDKLNIEGVIVTSHQSNATFVAMPANAVANNQASVFVVDKHLATKKTVKFGQRSVNYIEVLEGLNKNQTIIISDMEKYTQDSQVLVR